ncbi:MAG: iron ABC transporter permease, partial [Achromobacter pestifer]
MLPAANAVSAYRHILRRRAGLIALLLAAIFIALLIDFTVGPSGMPWRDLWHTLSAPASADPTHRVIVWDIRLPSALMAAL